MFGKSWRSQWSPQAFKFSRVKKIYFILLIIGVCVHSSFFVTQTRNRCLFGISFPKIWKRLFTISYNIPIFARPAPDFHLPFFQHTLHLYFLVSQQNCCSFHSPPFPFDVWRVPVSSIPCVISYHLVTLGSFRWTRHHLLVFWTVPPVQQHKQQFPPR